MNAILELAREPSAPLLPEASAPRRLGWPQIDRWFLKAVVSGGVVALLVRLSFVAGSDFPLNDGGLFYVMIRDLIANDYLLPEFTTYNHDVIPFMYPPLAFYIASLLEVLGVTVESTLRIVPLIASVASGISFLALARRLLQSDRASAFSLWSFLLLPAGFVWMIMGGGLTRSLGMLFALTFLWALHRFYTRPSRILIPLLALLATLTVLSHLEWAYFALYSGALFFIRFGRHRSGVIGSLLVCVATLVATMPWWAVVLSHHGLAPFVAAFAGSDHDWPALAGLRSLIFTRWTDEILFPVFGTLAAFGAIRVIAGRQYSILLWLLAIAILDPKGGTEQRLAIPVSMLAGLGLVWLIDLMKASARSTRHIECVQWVYSGLPAIVLAYAAFAAAGSASGLLVGLSPDERAAMHWAERNTPPAARFLIIDGEAWHVDRTREWFPVLANRHSINTVQGYEALPGAFSARVNADAALRECVYTLLDCVSQRDDAQFDYIFVPKRPPIAASHPRHTACCEVIRQSLLMQGKYRIVYDDIGATILAR